MPTHWWMERKKCIQYAVWLKAIIHDLNSPLGNIQSLPPLFIFQRAAECMGERELGIEGKGPLDLCWSLDMRLLEGFSFSLWSSWLLLASSVVCGWQTGGPFFCLKKMLQTGFPGQLGLPLLLQFCSNWTTHPRLSCRIISWHSRARGSPMVF